MSSDLDGWVVELEGWLDVGGVMMGGVMIEVLGVLERGA